ncbi:rhodanese-like domain-containing protein [Streptomyces sp. NBC_00687]|uniref:rhodanese-like domain-containing protein n=1 Tax=Streptomyces sp. NBC_00687 TaxID=2975807 RepID=UPI0022594B81|nr:rhodanese-like domain-containing protein [Streptomyces sp. NBC_00687]MCX4919965.1 rhodanese-like domain-containing protein [Streptomyces sp. NBC_00687]
MSPSGPGPGRIDPAQAHARTAPGGDAVLLDIREQDEWATGHAPHALHLPMPDLASGAALPPAAQGRPLVLICRSGRRSAHAAALLNARGVDAVDVTGGMQAWAAAQLPVIDDRGHGGSIA